MQPPQIAAAAFPQTYAPTRPRASSVSSRPRRPGRCHLRSSTLFGPREHPLSHPFVPVIESHARSYERVSILQAVSKTRTVQPSSVLSSYRRLHADLCPSTASLLSIIDTCGFLDCRPQNRTPGSSKLISFVPQSNLVSLRVISVPSPSPLLRVCSTAPRTDSPRNLRLTHYISPHYSSAVLDASTHHVGT
ncbi:hypothetical protein K466DRAFT_251623 [Polyporus arcularius HHB13444]|uniref:Uncharacterized protein n=1 Tax=Polyporus arcularius HHB13444 TaxID=1314778 RepID=A0A5C3PRC0_9APHY|nr:hypothetical protein K466DRAFT_251623 [Polyporus arcularius HHB13444]